MAASTTTKATHVVPEALFRRIQGETRDGAFVQLDCTQRASDAADLFARL